MRKNMIYIKKEKTHDETGALGKLQCIWRIKIKNSSDSRKVVKNQKQVVKSY